MKKTVKYILGAAVALAMTATGAFAEPIVIDSLPWNISEAGDYHLQLPPDVAPVTGYANAIYITGSNVNLDLNGNTIDCQQGIIVYNGVNHVSIKNGTFNCTEIAAPGVPDPALRIDPGCSFITVENVNFNGGFGYSPVYGNHVSLKNCNFESPVSFNVDPVGHNTCENLTVARGDAVYNPIGNPDYSLYSAGPSNSFKNIRVLSGTVQLSGTDTYDHFFFKAPSTLNGGTNLKPGK
jgi:hypothetical protein